VTTAAGVVTTTVVMTEETMATTMVTTTTMAKTAMIMVVVVVVTTTVATTIVAMKTVVIVAAHLFLCLLHREITLVRVAILFGTIPIDTVFLHARHLLVEVRHFEHLLFQLYSSVRNAGAVKSEFSQKCQYSKERVQ
jgi:hypothetical protein